MPYVGDDVPVARKRRRDEEDDDIDHNCFQNHHHNHGSDILRLYAGHHKQPELLLLNQPQNAVSRKPWPLSKRSKVTDAEQRNHSIETAASTHRRRASLQKLLLGAVRVEQPQRQPGPNSLAPCHICHRRPTRKSDLDSFAECRGCGERTCFVCIRGCQGWSVGESSSILPEQDMLSRSFHMEDATFADEDNSETRYRRSDESATRKYNTSSTGTDSPSRANGWGAGGHRDVVCSRCCVERGAHGDVMCLGCLSTLEGV